MATEYEKTIAAAKAAQEAKDAKSRIPTGGTESDYLRLVEQARQQEEAKKGTAPITQPPPSSAPDLPPQDLAPGVVSDRPDIPTVQQKTPAPSTTPKTTKPEIPRKPDKPGGQVATVDGVQYYIAGSTMRETYGFETPEQYFAAQRYGYGSEGNAWYGPNRGGNEAVIAFSREHGIPEDEARRIITKYWQNPNDREFETLTQKQRDSLFSATREYNPWLIAPESVVGQVELPGYSMRVDIANPDVPGTLKTVNIPTGFVVYAASPELQAQANKATRSAINLLKKEGLLDSHGILTPGAFEKASKELKIRQALYDVGYSSNNLNIGIEFEKSLKTAPDDVRNAYETGGFEQYLKAVGIYNAQVGTDLEEFIVTKIKPDSYLNSILKSKGEEAAIAAYKKRHEDIAGILERNYTRTLDGKYVLNKTLEKLKDTNAVQYGIIMSQGYDAFQEAKNEAEAKLKKYHIVEGHYNLIPALADSRTAATNEKALELYDAIQFMFPVDELRDAVQTYNKNQADILKGRYKEDDVWSWQSFQAGVPAGLVGLAGTTRSTPFPHDDLLVYGLIAVAAGSIAAYNGIKNFFNKNKTLPKQESVVAIVEGVAVPVSVMTKVPPIEWQETFPGVILKPIAIPPTTLVRQKAADSITIDPLSTPLPKYQEGFTLIAPKVEDYIFVDPLDTIKPTAQDLYTKATVVAEAEAAVIDTLPQSVKDKLDTEATVRDVESYLASFQPKDEWEWETYRTAHEEYLKKLAIYQAAWQSYVNSVNPEPVKGGKIDDKTAAQIAAILLAQEVGKENEYWKEFTKALKTAREKGLSDSKAQTTALISARDMILAEPAKTITTQPVKVSSPVTVETAQSTAVKTGVTPATSTAGVKPAVKEATKTAEQATTTETATTSEATTTATSTATATAAATVTATMTATAIKLQRLKIPKLSSDDEKREFIKNAQGAVAWNMGKLQGREPNGKNVLKDVWHVRVPPYGPEDHVVVKGKAPEGAKVADGPGSAYETAQALGGKPSKPFTQTHGAVKAKVSPGGPKGVRISFHAKDSKGRMLDDEGDSRGRITEHDSKGRYISEPSKPISKRGGRVSSLRGTRITPPRRKIQ